MAENQPAPNPAPEPVAPQAPAPEPVTPPADPKPADSPSGPTGAAPAAPAITLSDEQKTYLKSQGIAEENLFAPESLTKLINHAQSSQRTASEAKNQLDKIKGAVNPQPETPTNPLVAAAPGQPDDGATPTIDPVTAYNLSNNLATNFPELKEDLVSGKFYSDMQALGIPLMVGGQANLNGMLGYGKQAQERAQMQAKLDESGKPAEGAIPDANPTTPAQPADDAPMTKQMALAIAQHTATGGTHARAEEAKSFLQKSV